MEKLNIKYYKLLEMNPAHKPMLRITLLISDSNDRILSSSGRCIITASYRCGRERKKSSAGDIAIEPRPSDWKPSTLNTELPTTAEYYIKTGSDTCACRKIAIVIPFSHILYACTHIYILEIV